MGAARIKGDRVVATCHFCGQDVQVGSQHVWQRTVGWERKAPGDTRKGGSDIALREPRDDWAHDECVQLQKRGLGHLQESVL